MKCGDASIEVPQELTESRRAALLSLLADEDPLVYQAVRQKILSLGPGAAVWLRPHTLSRDPPVRRRALEIVRLFDRQEADNTFLAFCLKQGEQFDLEEAAWLLALTQYPDINPEAHGALLDSFAGDLRERLDLGAEPRRILTTINHYLFEELGFSGNNLDYYDPENSYLNRVIDRRTGNPINLCLVYLLLARRLHLPVAGIGLPRHFVCRLQTSTGDLYIDVFNGGKILTKANCIQYLLEANFSVRDDYLAPVSSRRFLLRVCANLHQIYLHLKLAEEATRLQRYIVALGR